MIARTQLQKKADQEWSAGTAYAYVLSVLLVKNFFWFYYFLAHHNGVNTSSGPPKNPTACV